MSEINHTPAAVIRYSEMGIYLTHLPSYSFLDPYLRQFLYRLYHCKLYFKRYKLNINDMLNFNEKCILCNLAIDTPVHLFKNCIIGEQLRHKRDMLLNVYNIRNVQFSEEKIVYSCIENKNRPNNIIQLIITTANYSIYRMKMKKYYDHEFIISQENPVYTFVNRMKMRIMCDHIRFSFMEFKNIWDPNNTQALFSYNENKILTWNF